MTTPQALTPTCRHCQHPFLVDEAQLDFLARVSPVVAGQQQLLPAPTLCPRCRLQRRLAYRNPLTVDWRSCEVSGKKILSAFPSASRARVVDNEIWWSDQWAAEEYARGWDPQRSFLTQFQELRDAVPYAARLVTTATNSDYCSNANELKDCYFVFGATFVEDAMYCEMLWWGKNCVDCSRCLHSELCYDCIDVHSCYNLQSSEHCHHCQDSYFLSFCQACDHCFGCSNLNHKRYHLFNQAVSEEHYNSFLNSLNLCSYSQREQVRQRAASIWEQSPKPHSVAQRVEDCSGNYLESSARVSDSYFCVGAEDCRFCFMVTNQVKNCQDFSHFGNKVQNLYECQTVGHDAFQLLFCRDCWNGNSDLIYCASCFGCEQCFGCVGLRKKRHCILNTQYSEAEYNALLPRIIMSMQRCGEWGEFFPLQASPFPYNTSFAARYFPLTELQARGQGLEWYAPQDQQPNASASLVDLPDQLPLTDDALTARSVQSGRLFRITSQEIKRYRELHVPLPRISYAERMQQRWQRLGAIELRQRSSARSGEQLLSSFDAAIAPVLWSKDEWDQEFR